MPVNIVTRNVPANTISAPVIPATASSNAEQRFSFLSFVLSFRLQYIPVGRG